MAFSFIVIVACWGTASDGVRTGLGIRIRVYNYARVSDSVLSAAEKEATGIFEAAGIRMGWLRCPTEKQVQSECSEPLIPAEVILRVLGRPDSDNHRFTHVTFGFAVGPALASVYYSRALELADRHGAPAELPVILAHAITHEVGHLLLGSASHSPTGIMCAHWDRDYLHRALMGRQSFNPDQSKRIRSELESRTGRQDTLWAALSPK